MATESPQSKEPKESESLANAVGCCLLLMGGVGAAFGTAALLGLSERIELEFFRIELNDAFGRLVWTVSCFIAIVVGVLILRARGAPPNRR